MLEATTAQVVARARGLVRPGRRVLLGITGAPGAGKSTLAEALVTGLGDDVAVVGMDGFHLADAELVRSGRRGRKGAPDTFDPWGYAALLARLRAADEPVVWAPVFDRGLEDSIAQAVAVPREVPLVVTEGNYLLLDDGAWRAARACLDAVWFLDPPPRVRVDRLVARHERYGLAPDVARARATSGSDGANAALVEATRDRADLVIRLLD